MSRFYNLEQAPFNNRALARSIVASNNGLLFDPSDLSTLYQDAAGTIPVTAVGQPVGKVLDKSGNGYHATQPITASRPTLVQINGLYALSFDGIDDYLNLPYMGLYANGSASGVYAITNLQQTQNSALISERDTASIQSVYIPRWSQDSTNILDTYIRSRAGTVLLDSAGVVDSIRDLRIESFVDAGINFNTFKNSVITGSSTYSRSGLLTLVNTTIGASVSTTTSNYTSMKLYGLIITKSALTDAQRVRCERFLAQKSGVML